jgi:hypothetical protein
VTLTPTFSTTRHRIVQHSSTLSATARENCTNNLRMHPCVSKRYVLRLIRHRSELADTILYHTPYIRSFGICEISEKTESHTNDTKRLMVLLAAREGPSDLTIYIINTSTVVRRARSSGRGFSAARRVSRRRHHTHIFKLCF